MEPKEHFVLFFFSFKITITRQKSRKKFKNEAARVKSMELFFDGMEIFSPKI